MTKTKIANYHEVSLRPDPTLPENDEETLAILKNGEEILVDTDAVFFDWLGERYFKAETPSGLKGYIVVKGTEIGGLLNG